MVIRECTANVQFAQKAGARPESLAVWRRSRRRHIETLISSCFVEADLARGTATKHHREPR
jgi:hypothetical protein